MPNVHRVTYPYGKIYVGASVWQSFLTSWFTVFLAYAQPVTACYRGRIEHEGETMLKRSAAAFVAVLVGAAGLVVPAEAAQPTAKKYSSCAKLLDKYPNGVARNKKARNRAVKQGYERPQVRKKIYRDNRKRLDKDGDGVVCEKEKSSLAEDDAAISPTPDLSVIYVPTGLPIIDVIYGDKATRGEITQDQSNFIIAYVRTIAQQNVPTLCGGWKSQTFQDGVLDSFVTPEVLASVNLIGQDAWVKEMAGLLTSSWCVDMGYNYAVMLP